MWRFFLIVYSLKPLPRSDGDLTLAKRTAILDQITNQPPSTSHRLLTEITGVPVIQQQDKLRKEWALREGQQATS